jgi:hypothetical protein
MENTTRELERKLDELSRVLNVSSSAYRYAVEEAFPEAGHSLRKGEKPNADALLDILEEKQKAIQELINLYVRGL